MVASHALDIGASDIGVLIRMYDALYYRRPDLDGLDNSAFVAHLYHAALERDATARELSEWNVLLANGHVDRGDVLLALVESAEMVALVGVMSTTFEVT